MNPVFLGIGSAIAAAMCFAANDVIIKFLSGDYALHQVVLVRSVVGLAVVLGLFVPLAGGWGALRTRRLGLHLLRGSFVLASNLMYFAALSVMPLAEAMAVFFVAPLLMAALSVPILREYVGPRRWAAIAVGLVGVALVIKPGASAFQPAALLVLGAAGCYAMVSIMARRIGRTESALTLAFYVQLMFIGTSALVGLVAGDGGFATSGGGPVDFLLRAWVWPAPVDWGLMALAGAVNGLAGYLIATAYRSCDVGLIAPFEYAALPIGVALGYVIFAELPDAVAWLGIALIICAGLYMAWRETRKGKA